MFYDITITFKLSLNWITHFFYRHRQKVPISQDIFPATRARAVILKSAVPISSIGATSCGDGSANMFRSYWIGRVHSRLAIANVKTISLETTFDRKGPFTLHELRSHTAWIKVVPETRCEQILGYIHTQQKRKRTGTEAKFPFSSAMPHSHSLNILLGVNEV